MKRWLLLAGCWVALAAAGFGPAVAQESTLAGIDSLVAGGRFTQARAALAQWQRHHPRTEHAASPRDQAHALLLRGRLAGDAQEAQDAYLALILSYPSTPSAPEALLRLGQGLTVGGEPQRAAAYLERLLADYPGHPLQPEARLWLARAYRAAGRTADACTTATAADRDAVPDEALRSLLGAEATRACDTTTQPEASQAARASTPASAGDYAVQVAALRDSANAGQLRQELASKGFDARVVTLAANDLQRVRVGRFRTLDEAARTAERLRSAGYDAIVVDDAGSEKSITP